VGGGERRKERERDQEQLYRYTIGIVSLCHGTLPIFSSNAEASDEFMVNEKNLTGKILNNDNSR